MNISPKNVSPKNVSPKKASPKTRGWFRWHYLYYILAGFDVLTISLTLFLSHTVLGIYTESVNDHAVWSERVGQLTRLNEMAAAVNSPGNDAFESGDISTERKRLRVAYDAFDRVIAASTADLEQNASPEMAARLIPELQQVSAQVRQIRVEADKVFLELERDDTEAAGSHMAEMDRCFARSIHLIGHLCDEVRAIQAEAFVVETARAQKMGRYEYAIAGVIFVILCGITWFGHTIAKQMQKSEYQYQESEEKIRAIVETAVDPIITMTDRGLIESFNTAAEKLFGYFRADVLGKNISMLMPSPYREEHDGYLAAYRATGIQKVIGTDTEVIGQHRDGSTFSIRVSVSEVEMRSQNSPRLFTGIIHDLTKEKQREAELERAKKEAEKLSAFGEILDESLNEIYICDVETLKFLHANHGAQKNLGYSLTELREMTPLELGCEQAANSFDELVAPLYDGVTNSVEVTGVHTRKDGSTYPVEIRLQRALFDGRSVYIAFGLDVTERQKIDEKLRVSHERALVADQSKSEFLANMSHEIRTPMTAILGFTDILIENVEERDQLDAAQTIKANSEYLLNIINDILDISKIEAGKLDAEMVPVAPRKIIDDIVELVRVRTDAKNLEFVTEFEGAIPETILSDSTRIRQILINLVGNAIKFTETGSVKILVRMLESESLLQFDVIDTGLGISEEKIDDLFLPFVQADTSTTRQFGGTGLGLTISRRLAELLGGTISVSSELGQGSCFSVTIAAPVIAECGSSLDDCDDRKNLVADVVVDSKEPLKGCSILLAEDGPDNQRLIRFILQKAGATVTVAENGQIAFDLATAAVMGGGGKSFDMILMDMQMPVLDGYAATRQLRESNYTGPIFALTAHAMSGDRKKCLDAGCDDFFTKPIDKKTLIERVAYEYRLRQASVEL